MKCAPPFESGSILTSTSPALRTRSTAACRYAAIEAANRGVDLWIDQTTLSAGSAFKLLNGLNKLQPLYTTFNMIIFEQMCTPLAVCLERKGFECVPEDTMLDMAVIRQKAYTIDTRLPMIICRHTINDMY